MILYPAMDLMGGSVVRLKQGRFEQATTYSDDPAQALRTFEQTGAEWAHVVDLDGGSLGQGVWDGPIAGEEAFRLAGAEDPARSRGGGRPRRQMRAVLRTPG